MVDGAWVCIQRGTKQLLGWIEKNQSLQCRDALYQTYYFYTVEPNRSKEPILIYSKDIQSVEQNLTDEDYHCLQLLALDCDDMNWFEEIGAIRKSLR